MSLRTASVLLTACLVAGAHAAELADFRTGGRTFQADVYRPAEAPRGTVVLAHGFLRDRHSMGSLARELAERGALVIVPDLPFLADPSANAVALADIVIDTGPVALAPCRRHRARRLFGRWTGRAAGDGPHSGISGWIGLDPVDRAGEGVHAAARVSPPALMLRAAPDRCNAYANSHSWAHSCHA